MLKNELERFKLIGLIEGYSYLILLFIAMPIKYMGGEPMAVKIVGMAHGVLFILFILAQYQAANIYKWKFKFNAFAFVASLVPFGTFYLDKKLKKIPINS